MRIGTPTNTDTNEEKKIKKITPPPPICFLHLFPYLYGCLSPLVKKLSVSRIRDFKSRILPGNLPLVFRKNHGIFALGIFICILHISLIQKIRVSKNCFSMGNSQIYNVGSVNFVEIFFLGTKKGQSQFIFLNVKNITFGRVH